MKEKEGYRRMENESSTDFLVSFPFLMFSKAQRFFNIHAEFQFRLCKVYRYDFSIYIINLMKKGTQLEKEEETFGTGWEWGILTSPWVECCCPQGTELQPMKEFLVHPWRAWGHRIWVGPCSGPGRYREVKKGLAQAALSRWQELLTLNRVSVTS